MGKDHKKQVRPVAGEGYCLLPWGERFREGELAMWPDASLAVLPVIAAHASRDGKAWPGYERICALAHASKSTVKQSIDDLIADEWIEVDRRHGKSGQNEYQLLFRYDRNNTDKNYNRQWMRLDHKLIFNGVWGAMPPATRRVYLIFRAFAWAGLSAVQNGYYGSGYIDPEAYYNDELGEPVRVKVRGKWEEFHFYDVQFLPDYRYDPATFMELSGVKQRTFRHSLAWLLEEEIIYPYVYDENADEESMISGFVIPFQPVRYFPHILEAVEKVQEEKAARYKGTSGGKRSFAAILRRAG